MKRAKYIIIGSIPIVIGVVLFLFVNVFYAQKISALASTGVWFDSLDSKTAFMLAEGKQYDVVFLGSSRTQNHINTHWLGEHGIDSFNMGLPARGAFDQIDSLCQAVRVAKKFVVLSIPAQQLFTSRIKFPNRPTLSSFFYFTLQQPSSLKDMDMDRLLKISPLNRNTGIVQGYNYGKANEVYLKEELERAFGYSGLHDPREIHLIRGRDKSDKRKQRMVVLYTNGDSVIFGDDVQDDLPWRVEDYTEDIPNSSVVRYVNYLSDLARRESVVLVLNLIPSRPATYCRLDINRIQEELPDCIILNSQFRIDSRFWADKGHLGYAGANMYTEHLLPLLKELVTTSQ